MQNCWQATAVHKCDTMLHLINTPLRMCREREMQAYGIVAGISLVIIPTTIRENIFFLTPAAFDF